ncbi:MAG TPA: hybrid sensor histidine kinase/response regulator, partial [Beijerinckiaceae bacterium]|nr:hybrid sensor histidine kinase/response regulator [Beijerinckiaceae bacterium]
MDLAVDWTALASMLLGGALAAAAALAWSRADARTKGAAGEVETLQDRLWRLAESEERYRAIVEAQVDAFVQRDARGRITAADAGYLGLLGPAEATAGSTAAPEVVERGPVQVRHDARLVEEAIRTPAGLRWYAWVETTVAGPD